MRQVRDLHTHDQNFPTSALEKINRFLNDPEILANPENIRISSPR